MGRAIARRLYTETNSQKCECPKRGKSSSGRALCLASDGLFLLAEGDYAEGTVAVIVVAGGEEELIEVAVCAAALAELNGPDVVDLDGFAACVAQGSEERAALRVEGVDAATWSVIGDQERIAHWPEVCR